MAQEKYCAGNITTEDTGHATVATLNCPDVCGIRTKRSVVGSPALADRSARREVAKACPWELPQRPKPA